MTSDPMFYVNWCLWAGRKTVALIDKGNLDTLHSFIFDILDAYLVLMCPLQEFPLGSPFKIIVWALKNRDPLKPGRDQMRIVQATWGVP